MKKKIISILLSLGMIAGLLSGCGGDSKTTSTSTSKNSSDTNSQSESAATQGNGEKVTLRILDTYGDMVEQMCKLYEMLNPNVTIEYEYVSSDSYYAKFTALSVANEMPDVYFTNANYMVEQVQGGLAMDLTEEIEQGQNYEKDAVWGETFNQTLINNCKDVMKTAGKQYSNHLYGVPFTMTTVAVVYDKAVFDKLGIKVPTNWEEFESNNESIKQAGLIPISMQEQNLDWWPRILWDQYCREELETNPNTFTDGTMTFDSASVQKGIEKFKEMWDAGWFPESGLTGDRDTMTQLFVQKKMPQLLIQPNYLQYLEENVPDDVELASYALPASGDYSARCLGGSSNIWAVSQNTQNKDAAIEFVKFLTSKTAFTRDYAKYINSGLTNVESSVSEVFSGYIKAGENGFIPDIYVPANATTEMSNTFKTDLLPNYLLGTYTMEDVTGQLNTMYQDGYLTQLNQ